VDLQKRGLKFSKKGLKIIINKSLILWHHVSSRVGFYLTLFFDLSQKSKNHNYRPKKINFDIIFFALHFDFQPFFLIRKENIFYLYKNIPISPGPRIPMPNVWAQCTAYEYDKKYISFFLYNFRFWSVTSILPPENIDFWQVAFFFGWETFRFYRDYTFSMKMSRIRFLSAGWPMHFSNRRSSHQDKRYVWNICL